MAAALVMLACTLIRPPTGGAAPRAAPGLEVSLASARSHAGRHLPAGRAVGTDQPLLRPASAAPMGARRASPLMSSDPSPPREGADDVFAFGSFEPVDTTRRMADPASKALVLRALIDALDQFRPWEVAQILDRLWAAGPRAGPNGDTITRLLAIADRMAALEADCAAGRAPDAYALADEVRFLRARARQYAQDARAYPGPAKILGFD
mmetsp:Transcript_16783/g.56376  ORF Transcript_16783/g.56376 Transcript_16783/m.56376 type:complete len:208 (-) Transcript_16783:201-824(-)